MNLESRTKKYVVVIGACIAVFLLAMFMRAVFNGAIILPQEIHLGPLAVRYYGIFIALAAGSGYWLALRRAPRFGIASRDADRLLLAVLVFGFIGARLYHVLSDLDFYLQNPLMIAQVWKGGLGIYGAVGGGIIGLWIAKKFYQLSTTRLRQGFVGQANYQLLDWLAPSVLLGQIIGRFGNFFNYELFGYPSSLPWKMFVPLPLRPAQFSGQDFFHPLFLYEQMANLAALVVLLAVERRRFKTGHAPGTLFFCYLLFYGIIRFLLEFLRIDSVFIYGIRQNAVVSAILVIVAAVCLYKLHSRNQIDKKISNI